MIKQPSPYEQLIDDSELRFILKNYDPVEQPSQASMSVLEASIFAQIDGKEQNSLRAESRFPVWILSRDWKSGSRNSCCSVEFWFPDFSSTKPLLR